jgi:hypothetical protein
MTAAMKKIERVTARPDYKLTIMWTDGQQMNVDLSYDVKTSGVWQDLADPVLFQDVRVSDNKYAIEWPKPSDEDGEPLIDIDSDGLYWLAINQLLHPYIGGIMEKMNP